MPEIPERILDVLEDLANAMKDPARTTAELEPILVRLARARGALSAGVQEGAGAGDACAAAVVSAAGAIDAAIHLDVIQDASYVGPDSWRPLVDELARLGPWLGEGLDTVVRLVAQLEPHARAFAIDYMLSQLLDAGLERLGWNLLDLLKRLGQ